MSEIQIVLMSIIFFLTVIFIMIRPFGINETIFTSVAAFFVLLLGIVPFEDIFVIFTIIRGASVTIISTIIMSIILESLGLFRWIAFNIVKRANGSGRKLFWYIIFLCFLTTLFFNNDGSILITTPIIIQVVKILELKPHQKIPYLLSGALIATVASAPIALSNIANLIALKIVNLTLNSYVEMMFVPSMLGIIVISGLLYFYFKRDIPKKIQKPPNDYHLFEKINTRNDHPLKKHLIPNTSLDWGIIKICMGIVVMVRISYFVFPLLGVPIEVIGIVGAGAIIFVRWYKQGKVGKDILYQTPWEIFLFAFSMYVIVYGLRNIGLNSFLTTYLGPFIMDSHVNAIFVMGLVFTFLSNLFNNLPAIMIGTLMITDMGLDVSTLQVAYLANILGSDIGALLTPVGTLATLIWMFILKRNHIHISWYQYIKVTIRTIPIGLLISLLSLYLWTKWLSF